MNSTKQSIILMGVLLMSVILPKTVMLSMVTSSVVRPSVIMLSVVMLSVMMLSVMAPLLALSVFHYKNNVGYDFCLLLIVSCTATIVGNTLKMQNWRQLGRTSISQLV